MLSLFQITDIEKACSRTFKHGTFCFKVKRYAYLRCLVMVSMQNRKIDDFFFFFSYVFLCLPIYNFKSILWSGKNPLILEMVRENRIYNPNIGRISFISDSA